jgi:hypothetical protein
MRHARTTRAMTWGRYVSTLRRCAPSPACGGGLGWGCHRITAARAEERLLPPALLLPYRWRFDVTVVTLALRSCVARQEPYIPGALSILQGTVPGRVRGSGHMVPTYFRRELRDRVLQRPSRLRTLFFLLSSYLRRSVLPLPSCPAKAGYPVRRSFTVLSPASRNTGSPVGACHPAGRRPDRVAGDDSRM